MLDLQQSGDMKRGIREPNPQGGTFKKVVLLQKVQKRVQVEIEAVVSERQHCERPKVEEGAVKWDLFQRKTPQGVGRPFKWVCGLTEVKFSGSHEFQ